MNIESEIKSISFDEFKKIELRVGKIINAEKVVGYNKLLKILVDIGYEQREIMSGIAKYYEPQDILNKYVIVCTNLEPRNFGDNKSHGMLLAAEDNGKPILLTVSEDAKPGSLVS